MLLRKIMQGFQDQYRECGLRSVGKLRQGRVEEASRLAHSLKGVAATLEASDLSAAAAEVEQALRKGRMGGLSVLIQTLDKAVDPAIVAASFLEGRQIR
jgi:HPt (histidine-containing phosphotransfer) domain-containing protein